MKDQILLILKEYIEEARLSDVLKVTGDKTDLHKYIEKEKSKEFEIDRGFPTQLTLKKRYNNKKIKVHFNWHDILKHDLKKRIKERTSFKSISEFTELFKDVVNYLLPNFLGVKISQNGKYVVFLTEYNLALLFSINLDHFDEDGLDMTVITVLPKTQVDKRDIVDFFEYSN